MPPGKSNKRVTADPAEIAKFSALAEEWWDEKGKFKPLHLLNPVRVAYIRDRLREHCQNHESGIANREKNGLPDQEKPSFPDSDNAQPLHGLSILDIGCGGGLLCEPLTRLGACVTGIDASAENIKIASLHAKNGELEIDYRQALAEDLAKGKKRYDAVLAMEVIEHVADVDAFLESCGALVKPGGLLFAATLNRTVKSYALAIVGAEYVLRWLPRGTHDWTRFLRPSEIERRIRADGLELREVRGVSYDPFRREWKLSHDTSVNYMMLAAKPESYSRA